MKNKHLKISMQMAIVLGVFLPLAESVRKIHQIIAFENFLSWFDDYTLGAVLLLAAASVYYQKQNSTEYLIAAWGMAVGGLTLSLYGQITDYCKNMADAGIFASGFVLGAKALILFYIFVGLFHSIKASPPQEVPNSF